MESSVASGRFFLISAIVLTFNWTVTAGNEPPAFLKDVTPLLGKRENIDKIRAKPAPLPPDKQAELMKYYKSLNSDKPKELQLMIDLAPFLASRLSFDNFKDLANWAIFESYFNPDKLKFAFLQELGYMALREKSAEGKAFLLLKSIPVNAKKNMSRFPEAFSYNFLLFSRIEKFVALYEALLPTIDKNSEDKERLEAAMENELGDNPRKIFILNHRSKKEEPLVYEFDSSKQDSARGDSQAYYEMLADLLDYHDPKVRMAAVTGLQEASGKFFNYNPADKPDTQKAAIAKWRKYVKEHDLVKERKQVLLKKYRRLPKKR